MIAGDCVEPRAEFGFAAEAVEVFEGLGENFLGEVRRAVPVAGEAVTPKAGASVVTLEKRVDELAALGRSGFAAKPLDQLLVRELVPRQLLHGY